MSNSLKVLKFFMDNSFSQFTILDASKKLGMNYRIVFEEIKKFEEKGLIWIEKIGRSNACRFNPLFSPETLSVEIEKRNKLLDNKDFSTIYKRVFESQYPFFVFLVFGSHASFSARKNSDIDICIIADDTQAIKNFEALLNILPFDMHLLSFSSKEFISMIQSHEENVGKEISRNHIIFKGEQAFYEMIRHAR